MEELHFQSYKLKLVDSDTGKGRVVLHQCTAGFTTDQVGYAKQYLSKLLIDAMQYMRTSQDSTLALYDENRSIDLWSSLVQ